MNEKTKIILEKAQYYFSNQTSVHISTILNKFYNGILVRINKSNIIIQDERLGEVFLLVEEIENIEPRESKEFRKLKELKKNEN